LIIDNHLLYYILIMRKIRRRKKHRWGNIKLALKNAFSMRSIIKFTLIMMMTVLVSPVVTYILIKSEYSTDIKYTVDEISEQKVAIVFGAGLKGDGTVPSNILQDRVSASVDLYKAGKVKKILMSGDNRVIEHNEPDVMIEHAVKLGVREFDLQPDYAGRSTYETCYRAKEVFGITKAVLVTQQFHLPRAIYICSTLGIDVVGYASDKHVYQDISYLKVREFLAISKAFWGLYVIRPEVVLGEKIYF